MRQYGVAYRLSPNEETQILQKEKDRRRKLRIQQVREQERRFAKLIREKVQAKKEQEVRILAGQLEQDWLESKLEKRELLEEVYKRTLESVGKAHNDAEQQPPYDDIRDQNRATNDRKARKRGQQAVQKQLEVNEKQLQEEFDQIITRKTALEIERARAALIAKKPKRQNDTNSEESEPRQPEATRVLHHEGFSTTHYTIQAAEYAEKAGPQEQGDAKEDAQREGERLEEEQQEKDREQEERQTKAAIRQKHAQNKERLRRDHERLQAELEQMEQADRRRRQLIVSDIPKQIFQPPHKRLEEKDDEQKDMEQAFENMYMANTDYAGDIELALEVSQPPAEAALDVSSDTPGEEFQVPEPRKFPRGLDRATTATKKNDTLKKLLQKVHSQRHDHMARQKAELKRGRVDTQEPPFVSRVDSTPSTAASSKDNLSTAASRSAGPSIGSSSSPASSTGSPSGGLSSIHPSEAPLSSGPFDSTESGESPVGVSSELSQHPLSSGSSRVTSSGQGSLETGSISGSGGTGPASMTSTLMHPLEEAKRLRQMQDQTRPHHWNMERGVREVKGFEPLQEEMTSSSPSPETSSAPSGIQQDGGVGLTSENGATGGLSSAQRKLKAPEAVEKYSGTGAASPGLQGHPGTLQPNWPIGTGPPERPVGTSQTDGSGPTIATQSVRPIRADVRSQWRNGGVDTRRRNGPDELDTVEGEKHLFYRNQHGRSRGRLESADAVEHQRNTSRKSVTSHGGGISQQALSGQDTMDDRSHHLEISDHDGPVTGNDPPGGMGARQATIPRQYDDGSRNELGRKESIPSQRDSPLKETEADGLADLPSNYLEGLPPSHLRAVGRMYPNIYEALTGSRPPPPDVGEGGPRSPVISVSSGVESDRDEGRRDVGREDVTGKSPSSEMTPRDQPMLNKDLGREDRSRLAEKKDRARQRVGNVERTHLSRTPGSSKGGESGPSMDNRTQQNSERSDGQGNGSDLRVLLRDYQEQLLRLQSSNMDEIAKAQAQLQERRKKLLRLYPQMQQLTDQPEAHHQEPQEGQRLETGEDAYGQQNVSGGMDTGDLHVDGKPVQPSRDMPHMQPSEGRLEAHHRQRSEIGEDASRQQNVSGGRGTGDLHVDGGPMQLSRARGIPHPSEGQPNAHHRERLKMREDAYRQQNVTGERSSGELHVDGRSMQLSRGMPHMQRTEGQPNAHHRERLEMREYAYGQQKITGERRSSDLLIDGRRPMQLSRGMPHMQQTEGQPKTHLRLLEAGQRLGRVDEAYQHRNVPGDGSTVGLHTDGRLLQPPRDMPETFRRRGGEERELENGRDRNGGSVRDLHGEQHSTGEGGVEDQIGGGWVTDRRHKQRQREGVDNLEQPRWGSDGIQDQQQRRDGLSSEEQTRGSHMVSVPQRLGGVPVTFVQHPSRSPDDRFHPSAMVDEVPIGSESGGSADQPDTSLFDVREPDLGSQHFRSGHSVHSYPGDYQSLASSERYFEPTSHQGGTVPDVRTMQHTPLSLPRAAPGSTESATQQERGREGIPSAFISLYGEKTPGMAVLRGSREVDVSITDYHPEHLQGSTRRSQGQQPQGRWGQEEESTSPQVIWRPVKELHVSMPSVNIPDQSPLTDTSSCLSDANSPFHGIPLTESRGEKQPKGLLTPRKLAQSRIESEASSDVGAVLVSGALTASRQISPPVVQQLSPTELNTPRMISEGSVDATRSQHLSSGSPRGLQHPMSAGIIADPRSPGSEPASPNARNDLPGTETSVMHQDMLSPLKKTRRVGKQEWSAMHQGVVRSPEDMRTDVRPLHQLDDVSARHPMERNSHYMAEFTQYGMTPYHRTDSVYLLQKQSEDQLSDGEYHLRDTIPGNRIIYDGHQDGKPEPLEESEDSRVGVINPDVTNKTLQRSSFAVGTDSFSMDASRRSSRHVRDPDLGDAKQADSRVAKEADVEPTDRGLLAALKNLMIAKARSKVPGVAAAPSTNYFGHLDLLNPVAREEGPGGGHREVLGMGAEPVQAREMDGLGTDVSNIEDAERDVSSDGYKVHQQPPVDIHGHWDGREVLGMVAEPLQAQEMDAVGMDVPNMEYAERGVESERYRVHQRPPVASRSKLQIFQEMSPHELSTIIEVDSPLFETLPSSLSFTAGTDDSPLGVKRDTRDSTSATDDRSSPEWGTPHRNTPSSKTSSSESSGEIYIHQPTMVSALEEVPLGDGGDSMMEASHGGPGSLTTDSALMPTSGVIPYGIVTGGERLHQRSSSPEQRWDHSREDLSGDYTLSEGPLSTSTDSSENQYSEGRGSHLSRELSDDASPFPISAEVIKRRMPQLSFEGSHSVTATDVGYSRSQEQSVTEMMESVMGYGVLEGSRDTASQSLPMNQLPSQEMSEISGPHSMPSSSRDRRVGGWERRLVSDYTIPPAMGIQIEESVSERRLPGTPKSVTHDGDLEEGPLEDTIQGSPEGSTGLEEGPLDDTLTEGSVTHLSDKVDSTISSDHSFRPLQEQRGSEERPLSGAQPREIATISLSLSSASAPNTSVNSIRKNLSYAGSRLEEGPLESTREVSRPRDASSIPSFSAITASDKSSMDIGIGVRQLEPSHSGSNLVSSKEEFRHGDRSGTPSYSAMSISSRLDFPPVISGHSSSGHSLDGVQNMRRLTPTSVGSDTHIGRSGHRQERHTGSGLEEGPLESTREEMKARDVTSIPSFSAIASSEKLGDNGRGLDTYVRSLSREDPLESMRGASESSMPWFSELSTSSRFDLPPVFSGLRVEPSNGMFSTEERRGSLATTFGNSAEEFRVPPNTTDWTGYSSFSARSASFYKKDVVIEDGVHRVRPSDADGRLSEGPFGNAGQGSEPKVTSVSSISVVSASGLSHLRGPLSDHRMFSAHDGVGLEEGPLESTRMEFVMGDVTSIPSFSGISTAGKESGNFRSLPNLTDSTGIHTYGSGVEAVDERRVGSLDELLSGSGLVLDSRRQHPTLLSGQYFVGATDEDQHGLTGDRMDDGSHHSRGSQGSTKQSTIVTGIMEEPDLTFQTTFDTDMMLDSDTGGEHTLEGGRSTPSNSLLSFMRHEEQLAHSTPMRTGGQTDTPQSGRDEQFIHPTTDAGTDHESATPRSGDEQFAYSMPMRTGGQGVVPQRYGDEQFADSTSPTGTDDQSAAPQSGRDEQSMYSTASGTDNQLATPQSEEESCGDQLNTNTNAQEDSEPLSLQEALARHKAGFIKASRTRQTEVRENKVIPRATAFSTTLKNWQKAKLQAQQKNHRNKSGVKQSTHSNKENLRVPVKAALPKTSEDRKAGQKANKERTKRLYNQLEEVKTRQVEADRKKAYAENRKKRKEYEEKLKQKRALRNQQRKK